MVKLLNTVAHTAKNGFPPVAGGKPKALILGSMPGVESLRKGQYYAHPRNSFWFILGRLFKFDPAINYGKRKEILKSNHIALWDVLMACEREGSLDSSIIDASLVENDFLSFYAKYQTIRYVFFNGARAEKEYKKRVLPVVQRKHPGIKYIRLPSTSPAMASLTKEEKLSQWSVILKRILK
jgi:TDG/mug DNA glycosylase family protein